MRISLTAADKIFSKLVRARAGNACERCGRTEGKLDCSHHWSRRIKLLRFDPANACALCWQCHLWWHSNPGESGVWLRNKIGEEQYAYLVAKAREPFKFDRAMQAHVLRNLKFSWGATQQNLSVNMGLDFLNPYHGEVLPLARKVRAKKPKSAFKRTIRRGTVKREAA